jgi:hypothetical protein
MSVRLKPDGTVEADTPQELVEYQRSFSRNGYHAPKKSSTEVEDGPLPEAASKLVKLLWPRHDGMETREIARAFGLEHAKGIGGAANSLAAWGRRRNLKKKLFFKKHIITAGKSERILLLSDFFRKMVKEGKVPDVKLDT